MRYPSGGGGTQEAGGTVTESLVGSSSMRKRTVARAIGRVSTRFGEGGEQLDRRRARAVLNSGARESKVQTGRFLRGNLITDHGIFLRGPARSVERARFLRRCFRDVHSFARLDIGSCTGFTSSRSPSP